MEKRGTLCVDVSTTPLDADLFFRILNDYNTIFYDSRLNPKAMPPYAIMGDRGDIAVLDIADEKIKAKFDLLIKIEDLENEEKENGKKESVGDKSASTDDTADKDTKVRKSK